MSLLPESASTYGPQVDQLFWIILGITGFFFVLVQGALLVFVLVFKAKEGTKATYLHGNVMLEVVWTIIPTVILLGLAVGSQQLWEEIRFPSKRPDTKLTADVLAEQFAWNIRYAGPDGVFETPDDISTINQLHIPVGVPMLINIRSKDVLHSFFVPELRVKQDAVPGMPTQIWVEATRAGEFEIRCAELCGLGHYRMKGFVTTEPPAAFEAWLKETKANE